MIEVLNAGWLSVVVDGGRAGYGDIGVPLSPALDMFSFRCLNFLLGNDLSWPAIEVMGTGFELVFHGDLFFAVTGAKVRLIFEGTEVKSWIPHHARKGNRLEVKEVLEGLRYYVGFPGMIDSREVMGSRTTNIECLFGGYSGRPLMKGDRISVSMRGLPEERTVPIGVVPSKKPPHLLRVIPGPEWEYFSGKSRARFFSGSPEGAFRVSSRINRTGIRLEGAHLQFGKNGKKSILSEGLLYGTIQVPLDGVPIIGLGERTMGGYARIAVVIGADNDCLAHLKPGDSVIFQSVTMDEAQHHWQEKNKRESFLL